MESTPCNRNVNNTGLEHILQRLNDLEENVEKYQVYCLQLIDNNRILKKKMLSTTSK